MFAQKGPEKESPTQMPNRTGEKIIRAPVRPHRKLGQQT